MSGRLAVVGLGPGDPRYLTTEAEAVLREAEAICKKASKRLCTENEWTFACEGEEVRPYPYGWTRDATACVIDRAWRPFAEGALQPRDGNKAREELDRLLVR